jgi:hypothetical protein
MSRYKFFVTVCVGSAFQHQLIQKAGVRISTKPIGFHAPTQRFLRRLTATVARGPAKGHGRACSRPLGGTGGGRANRDSGGKEPIEIRGSTSYKANCPCTSAPDVGRKPGAGGRANHRRCRTAAAGCTGECRQALRRAIGTRSSTAATPPKQLHRRRTPAEDSRRI